MRNPFVRLLGFSTLALLASAAFAGQLTTTAWLEKNLGREDVLLLDASPPPMHAKGHIPGAVPVDVFSIASFAGRDTPLPQMERTYQALGIDPKKTIVIYDQGGSWFATRIFFQLHYHGFPVENLSILDGGMSKWAAEGKPVTKDATPAPTPGGFRVTKVNEQSRTSQAELVAASGDHANNVLVDALGPEYHYGASAFFDKPGHIPHAVLMPADDFYNADKTFKSPEEIRRMLAYMGIRPEQEVHSHCGGGGAASVPYFALKHLAGHEKTKLSVDSQRGWLQDDRDLPFWTYGEPAIMRNADWLQSWGGRMMRMYGIARVSVVDVRAPAAYAQGHLPYALNVPGDTFRGNAKDPRKLAEVLGASGVNSSHEAVVVSGAGITKDAALAYVMLEKLGQARVSIFMDSLESIDALDKMARMNFAVTRDATIVGKPAKPTDLAVPPASYIVAMKEDKPAATTPKVYIASGAAVPSRAVDGKVVHVPYTELLKPDGTPKAAKDIWAILAKAGVPRYAELVTFSDDPGEAAANYYVLKLMGFPDVKTFVI